MFCQVCLDILELGKAQFVKVANPVLGDQYYCWHHLSPRTFEDSVEQGCQICTALWHDASVTAENPFSLERLPSLARTRLSVWRNWRPSFELGDSSYNSPELKNPKPPEPLGHLSLEITLNDDLMSSQFNDALRWVFLEVHEQSCMSISVT